MPNLLILWYTNTLTRKILLKMLTQQRLKELLNLNTSEGKFYYRISRGSGVAGNIAGSFRRTNTIQLDGRHYLADRLVFLYLYNIYPDRQVIHLDGNLLNNKPENLVLKIEVTQEILKKILNYCYKTGIFTWKIRLPYSSSQVGDTLGSTDRQGYMVTAIGGKYYSIHKLVWLYMTGHYPEYPAEEVDHINGIRNDNRWENLRLSSKGQNQVNSKPMKNNKSGYKGVYSTKCGNWQVIVKGLYLGTFYTLDDAIRAYNEKAFEFWGEFAILNPVNS